MDQTTLIAYVVGIIAVFFVGRIFMKPVKLLVKLIVNSLLGGFIIFVINTVGANLGFHIGLNIITALFVGILGIPGSIVLVLLKILVT